MAWLIAYGVGILVVMVLCGMVAKEHDAPDFFAAIFIGALWPVSVSFVIGAWLQKAVR